MALRALGFRVVALDASQTMLEGLRTKSDGLSAGLIRAEAVALPFAPSSFDAVVLSRVLYLISDWRAVLRETTRVLKPGARLLHEWGNGSPDEAWVQIRERARALFEEAGVSDPFHPGARSEDEVDQFLAAERMIRIGDVSLGPGPGLSLGDFLQKIADAECSYVWQVPAAIQARCLPALRAWAAERFDLDRVLPFPREIRWAIYRR